MSMSKTFGTENADGSITLGTAGNVGADTIWAQASGSIDVSSVVGYLSLQFTAGNTSNALTGDITLYVIPSLDGGTDYSSSTEMIPVCVIQAPGTTTTTEICSFDVTPYTDIRVGVQNSDETYGADCTLSYRTVSL